MNRGLTLTTFCKTYGLPTSVIRRWFWEKPEMRQFVEAKKGQLRYSYTVKDEEGLKEFLRKQGYTLREPANV